MHGHNPWQYIDRFAVEKRAKYVPTTTEINKLRMAAGVEYRLYLDIMDETAARPGEARQLAWEDVRFVEPPYMVLLYTRKTADGSRISRRMEISERLASSFAA